MQRAPSDAPRGKDETNMPEPEYKDVFAKNLKHDMAVNGKNQTDLMRDLGFSSSTISNWCTGQKLPRMDKVQQLADYFHVSRADLLESPEDKPADPYYLNEETRAIAQEIFENPEMRTLFHVARDIPPERLQAHIDFMKSLKSAEQGGDPYEAC